jgi:hypothetical protein
MSDFWTLDIDITAELDHDHSGQLIARRPGTGPGTIKAQARD